MRLGARLLLSVLLLTMYLPVAVVQATNGDTLVITGLSSTETVGVADLSLTVTDQTAGSANTSYTGTIHFASTDLSAVLPADYTFTGLGLDNGTQTFSVTFNTAGPQTVTATDTVDGTITPGSGPTNVTPVNVAPSFTKGLDQSVNENAGAQSVSGWATALNEGAGDSGQTLNFIVSNDNNALFSAQPLVSPTGTLTYTPAPNANGTTIVSVQIHDNGGTAGGGVDTSAVQTFTITVTPVNQVPSFTGGANQTVNENVGVQSVPNWATGLSAGPANESSQILSFIVTNDNNALFNVQPAVAANGTLTYTPAPNANGTTIVSVQIHDNGGTAHGGVDTSAAQTFTITVIPPVLNHAPTFIKGANITLPEEPSPVLHTFVGWATDFSPGPPSESTQTLLAYHLTNDHPLLFSTEPAIDAFGNLTFTLAANRNGPANVTVTVQDNGGTLNGGSDTSVPQMFTITVTGVDHPPAATNDFPTVVQGSGPVTIDVLANDTDPDGDPLTIASVTQGTNGHVAITANKKFLTYHPTGSFIGTDSFTYTASDGRGGLSVGTVLVTVVKDTFAPVTTAPRALIVAPPIGSSASITLTWSGTDRGFGIKTYQLQASRNHAPWASVTIRVGAHAARQTVALNSFYQYRVRAIDRVGNVGRWASVSFTPTLYRETSATYSGTWKSAALSGALNGSVKYTSALGAVASLTCTCSAFAWIGPKGPTRGTALVYVDTVLIGTFSEKSTKTLAAQRIMSVTWASRAAHKIGISVAGTGRVDVDGFLILH